jgi:hypothetical protein
MPTDEYAGTKRLERVEDILTSIRETYPDAKKLSIDIHFDWVTTSVYDDGAELCPVVKIYVER